MFLFICFIDYQCLVIKFHQMHSHGIQLPQIRSFVGTAPNKEIQLISLFLRRYLTPKYKLVLSRFRTRVVTASSKPHYH